MSTFATLDLFAQAITNEELLSIFPAGNRTPEAALCRLAAYTPTAVFGKPADILEYIKTYRDDPEFAPFKGHRRASWISAIALMVAVVARKKIRPLTPRMIFMITEAFDEGWLNRYGELLMMQRDAQIQWRKDRPDRAIMVPSAVAQAKDIPSWCLSPWPKLAPMPSQQQIDELRAFGPPEFRKAVEAGRIDGADSRLAPIPS